MFRSLLVLSAISAVLSAGVAHASAPADAAFRQSLPVRSNGDLKLAQAGDVEVYYDEFGRRVVVDSYTGEVLSVERPRRPRRDRLLGRVEPGDLGSFQGNLDDLNAQRERPRRYREPPVDYGQDQFPDAPQGVFPTEPQDDYRYPAEPEVVSREPIERRPIESAPVDNEPLGSTVAKPAPEAKPSLSIEELTKQPPSNFTAREDVASLQILLDRKGASPGVIDGKFGSNVDKAIVSYRKITGEDLKSTDAPGIKAALAASGGDPFTTYTITPEDAAGPYVASVPADYSEKAKLDRLSYTSVTEMLGERFHMDEDYLKSLNPEANFNRPGTIIRVANVGQNVTAKVKTIVADKAQKQVRAYDEAGKLVAAYPATIGSADTPSPTGTHAVMRIALDPQYTYNPKINFTQGENKSVLTIPPGPNGPVGSVWIALDKPTYGIHGTPDPSKIGKTESHGCVRLTNFDAQELAKIVSPGVTVEFFD